jgi:hypothetical protein
MVQVIVGVAVREESEDDGRARATDPLWVQGTIVDGLERIIITMVRQTA